MIIRKPIPEPDKLIIEEIANYLRQNLRHNITIEALSNKFYITRTRLLLLFKQLYGIPLKTYVTNQRMEAALKMLLETDKPIDEIARLCGYKHPNNFTRRFVLHYKNSPHELRKVNEKTRKKFG